MKDLIVRVMLNLFSGKMPYIMGTAQQRFFAKLLSRLDFVIKRIEPKLSKNGKKFNLKSSVFDTIGNNTGIDNNNTVIELR